MFVVSIQIHFVFVSSNRAENVTASRPTQSPSKSTPVGSMQAKVRTDIKAASTLGGTDMSENLAADGQYFVRISGGLSSLCELTFTGYLR